MICLCLYFSSIGQTVRHHCNQLDDYSDFHSFDVASLPASVSRGGETVDICAIVTRIQELMGLGDLPIKVEVGNVPNIHAVVERSNKEGKREEKRFIRYNPFFIRAMSKYTAETEDGEIIGLVAHEVGHHIFQHILGEKGCSMEEELQADEYAGYIMGLMCRSLGDATSFLSQVYRKQDTINPTFLQRKIAIEKGWKRGIRVKKCEMPEVQSMVFIKGGTFTMGCTSEQGDCNSAEKPAQEVTLSDYYMSPYELTFSEYDLYCEATGISKPDDRNWGRGNRPVIHVSWYDAVLYCNWRSEQEGLKPCYTIGNTSNNYQDFKPDDGMNLWDVSCDFTANGYRLPTEAEWEYAAREGGKEVLFGNGKNVADLAEMNIKPRDKDLSTLGGIIRNHTVPVTSFAPNSLGLYNMSGNVSEYCWDWMGEYSEEPQTNPTGAGKGNFLVRRGGSWEGRAWEARTSCRSMTLPYNRGSVFGLRLVRTAP